MATYPPNQPIGELDMGPYNRSPMQDVAVSGKLTVVQRAH
jgi:hypothetical protein